MRVLLFLSFLVAYSAAQGVCAVVGCRLCDGAGRCSECKDWYHLDAVNNVCKVGEVIDRYQIRTNPTHVYEGVVNGHPRHRVPVTTNMVRDPAGLITDMLYIRNRNTAATTSIFGVNHWYWTEGGDSSVYIWPTLNSGTPIDYSNIFNPAAGAAFDIFDVREVPLNRFRAKYNVTGALVFEGTVGGFSRVKIPITFLSGPKGANGATNLEFFIFNRITGNSWPIAGVSDYENSGFLYVWLVNDAHRNTLSSLIPVGSTFWIMQMRDQCSAGCLRCDATRCLKCMDGLFIDQNGRCKVGKVIDSYRTTGGPQYQGVVNGYPRWRIPVRSDFPYTRNVHNGMGYRYDPETYMYVRNRDTGASRRVYGVNHFWWSFDSALYLWPVRTSGEATAARLADVAAPITPANDAPIDLIDLAHIHSMNRRARYTTTGPLTYERVVNGFPRYRLPVRQLFRHGTTVDNTISTAIFLFNENTGQSETIHGVNHWLWSDSALYFWPVRTEAEFSAAPFNELLGATGTTFWVVQYDNLCPVYGCKECSTATTCVECRDNFYLDSVNNVCKVGVTMRRYTSAAAPVNEGVVNGYLRYRVRVSPTRLHAAHGLISDMAYIRNQGSAVTKKLFGVNHYFWSFDSNLYTWPVDAIGQMDHSGSWTPIYNAVNSIVEIYDVAALDPARFKAKYRTTGGIAYEGIVNGFPRYRVPIVWLEGVNRASLVEGLRGSNLELFILNVDNGNSRAIYGVNHWYWTSTHFYFWPVENVASLNTAQWNLIFPVTGTTFWVLEMQPPKCGDGVREELEECDDRNTAAGDGCSSTCTIEPGFRCPTPGSLCVGICGDNLLVRGEACEDGNIRNNDGCAINCVIETGWSCPAGRNCVPICGDGLLRGVEACDDRNTVGGDGCSANCRTVEDNFSCPTPGSPCVRAAIVCGNSLLESAENCDDGNKTPNDGCSSSCLKEVGWDCPTLGRPCVPICGDGRRLGAEACDDGNKTPNDGCSATCTIEQGWVCNAGAGRPCTSVCGDKIKTVAEGCDDGNLVNFDGCSSSCVVQSGWVCPTPGQPCVAARCGDGIIAGAERCEDGNTNSGDGCSSTCQREAGFICPTVGRPCSAICGDGLLRGAERCDDNNTLSGDGCSSQCQPEEGWLCPAAVNGVQQRCTPICGDGRLRGGEVCDDNNTRSGDGCSSTCQEEEGWECYDKYPGACCQAMSFEFPGWICNNGYWRPWNNSAAMTINYEYTYEGFNSGDYWLWWCGYFTLNADMVLRDTHLYIAGSLTINNGTLHLIGDSSIHITRHCGLYSDEASDYIQFAMDEDSTVAITEMDWTDPSEDETYADPRIWISGCAEVGRGTFYLEAENIPSGSNHIPFIVSNTSCIHFVGEDEEDVFESIEHQIPGTCSGVETETSEDEDGVDIVVNMKHLCPGSIAAIVVCSVLGGLLAIGIAVVALGGAGGGGADDYAAL